MFKKKAKQKKQKKSSQVSKPFFLYHVEKLILGLAIVLLGLFFWLGFKTEKFDKKSPSDLAADARSAGDFIVKSSSWEKISKFRVGDDKVMDRINTDPVDATKFAMGASSVPVKKDSPRKDPFLRGPSKMIAHSFSTLVLFEPEGVVQNPLQEYPPARPESDEDESMGMGGPGMGMGGPGMGMGGPGMGKGGPGMGKGAGKAKTSRKKKTEKADAGYFVPAVARYEFPGVRPSSFGLSPTSVQAFNLDVVSVTGLVEHKNMWTEFKNNFTDGVGYYPERDTVIYEFVQIERRAIGADGKPGEWEDKSDFIAEEQFNLFPDSIESAPEIVAPENYDIITTMPIPPFTQFDYKPYANHPELEKRFFEKMEVEEVTTVSKENIFNKEEPSEEDQAAGEGFGMFGEQGQSKRRRSRGGLGKGGGIGGMGMGGPGGKGGGPGMGMGGPGMGMGGPGMGMGGPGMGGMGGPGKGGRGMTPGGGRMASDMSGYEENVREEPNSDYKLVRFFDMSVRPGVKYEYRVRLWVADPNNEDPEMGSGSGMGMGGGPGMGMGGPGMGGPGMGMGGPGMGMDSEGNMTMGGKKGSVAGEVSEEDKVYKKTAITHQMKDPATRKRQSLAREEEVDGETVYYVSEKYKGDEDFTEVRIPAGHDYLKHCRPTKWSESVAVEVKSKPDFFYAGEIKPPRTVSFAKGKVLDGERGMDMVVGTAFKNAKLPLKTTVRAGALLNASKKAHVLHPVTWQVHEVEDAVVKTDAVLVDLMGGEQLGLPRSAPVQYNFVAEALVFDRNGDFHVRTDVEDRGSFRASLLLADEKAELNAEKALRRKEREEQNAEGMGPGMGMGGPGMGMGGPGMGKGGPGKGGRKKGGR